MSFDTILPPYNASDPTARFVASSCLDFLLIELVPMAYRITNQLDSSSPSSDSSTGDDAQSTATGPPAPGSGAQRSSVLPSGTGGGLGSGLGAGLGGGTAGGSVNGSGRKMDEDEERDAVFARLEALGYRVGQGLVERYVFLPFLLSRKRSWGVGVLRTGWARH